MQWINKEIKELLSNCYFASGHCPVLRIKNLSIGDISIYHESKEYKEFRKINSRWAQLSGNNTLFQELVGGMDFKQGNTVFWDDASVYVSPHTIGIISEFLEVLRLDTGKFREDRRGGRRKVFQRMKQITDQTSWNKFLEKKPDETVIPKK